MHMPSVKKYKGLPLKLKRLLFNEYYCHAAKSEHFGSGKRTCTCNDNNKYFIRMGMPKSGIVTCNYVLAK